MNLTIRMKRALRSRPAMMTAILRIRWQRAPWGKGQAAYRAYKDAQERENAADRRRRPHGQCPACNGTGRVWLRGSKVECPPCDGAGFARARRR